MLGFGEANQPGRATEGFFLGAIAFLPSKFAALNHSPLEHSTAVLHGDAGPC
jgi:hypothetical protein